MKKIFILCTMLSCILFSSITAFATSNETKKETDIFDISIAETKTDNEEDENNESLASGGIKKVTLDQASAWAERKGYDVIGFLQTIVQPISIIMFILGAFVTLMGSFGNSQLVGRGIFTMVISIVIYSTVLFAPEIVDFVFNWVKS